MLFHNDFIDLNSISSNVKQHIYFILTFVRIVLGPHTPTPTPPPLFNKFKLEFVKCNNLLNTHKTELAHCNVNLLNRFKSDLWGWGGFVWSPYNFTNYTFRKALHWFKQYFARGIKVKALYTWNSRVCLNCGCWTYSQI